MTEFARRFSIALYDKDMNQYNVAKKTGIHTAQISQYATGKRTPKRDKIIAIADALGVDPDWLGGESDSPEKKHETAPAADKRTARLLAYYERLTEFDKGRVMAYVEGILSSDDYAKKGEEAG